MIIKINCLSMLNLFQWKPYQEVMFELASVVTIIRSDLGFVPAVKYNLFSILFGMLQLSIPILRIFTTELVLYM
jgi:hypothetical protein